MNTSKRSSATALVVAALMAAWPGWALAGDSPGKKGGASHVELINGSKLSRVTLTQKAAERLDIKTAKVTVDDAGVITAPYAAVLYDVKGQTWVYTNPEPLVFVRHPVVIESIKGERATLKSGPAAGIAVVVVGASELYGAELGVGH